MSQHLQIQLNGHLGDFHLQLQTRVPATGVTAIFGPSGCGKSTLLRSIAGLNHMGTVQFGDQIWSDQRTFVPPERRPLAMVFQDAGLLSHLTVQGNLDYGLKRAARRGLTPMNAQQCHDVLALLDVLPLLKRSVQALSGGERQRVALARALIINPSLLMLDEPLSALDTRRKQEVLPYLRRIREVYQGCLLYVSHALDEVIALADQLLVLDNGRLQAQGRLAEVLPVLNLGDDTSSVLKGQVVEVAADGLAKLQIAEGVAFWLPATGVMQGDHCRLRVLARDVSISLSRATDSSILNIVPARIQLLTDTGSACRVQLQLNGGQILLAQLTHRSAAQLQLQPGMDVWAQVKSVALSQ